VNTPLIYLRTNYIFDRIEIAHDCLAMSFDRLSDVIDSAADLDSELSDFVDDSILEIYNAKNYAAHRLAHLPVF
jgi:hypothetical protein